MSMRDDIPPPNDEDYVRARGGRGVGGNRPPIAAPLTRPRTRERQPGEDVPIAAPEPVAPQRPNAPPVSEAGRGAVPMDVLDGEPPSAEAWPVVVPLDGRDLPPSFPVDALPRWLRAWATAQALALQVPVDMAAMLAVGTLAAVVQRVADVRIRLGWEVPTSMWIVVALPSADRKSPTFRRATAPAAQWERDQECAMKPAIVAATAKRAAAQKAQRGVTDPEQAAALAAAAEAIPVPIPPRIVADDVTPEILAKLLGEHGSIAVMASEGCGLFDGLAGRYRDGKGPTYATFLQGKGGDRILVDRVGRQSTRIESPRLTIVTTTQPDALGDLAAISRSRGTGLIARFAFVLPPSMAGRCQIRPPPVPDDVASEYDSRIRRILDELKPRDDGSRRLLLFSREADDRMAAFEAEIEPRRGPDGDLHHVGDWAGKLAGVVGGLAGILHVAEYPADSQPWLREVSETTVRDAIEIGRYLLAHALAAFDVMGADPDIERARKIWRWIERKGATVVSRRDIHDALRRGHGFERTTDLDAPLAVLVERGYLRPAPRDRRVGRPTETYDVRPRRG